MIDQHFIGITNNGDLAFADFGVRIQRDRPGEGYFGARFATVHPVCAEDIDLDQMYEDHIDDMDAEYKFELCGRLDCKPSDLLKEYRCEDEANGYKGLNAIMNFSFFPEVYTVNGEEWGFEDGCGGQHDLRETGMAYTVDQKAFDDLMTIWDEYHLKAEDAIPQKTKERIEELQGIFPSCSTSVDVKAIDGFLKTYIAELAYESGERADEDSRFAQDDLEAFAADPNHAFERFRSDAEALFAPSLAQVGREARAACSEVQDAPTTQRENAHDERYPTEDAR